MRVLEILDAWVARGWSYRPSRTPAGDDTVICTNPENPNDLLVFVGMSHFDALCQATTAMQIFLNDRDHQ